MQQTKRITFIAIFLLAGLAHSQISATAPAPLPQYSNCAWGDNPVCADDYTTYPSICALQDAGVNFVHYGECVQVLNVNGQVETNCPKVFEEICGMDGVTYGNSCRMDARNVIKAYKGPCRSATKDWERSKSRSTECDCPLEFVPVCTMSGTTYESNCVLLCSQQVALTMEPCSSQCACPKTYEPVCGADSKTYDNACTLECVRGNIIGYGECSNIIETCDNCSSVFMNVYSASGDNYDNLCRLNCNKGKFAGYGKTTNNANAKALLIKKNCSQCSKLYLPICGNDGKTYDNECLCTCSEKCEKYSNGICPTQDPQAAIALKYNKCAENGIKEVCGVDNRTYDNTCFLEKSKIQLQYPGPCRSRGEYSSHLPQNPANFNNSNLIKRADRYNDADYQTKQSVQNNKAEKREEKEQHQSNQDKGQKAKVAARTSFKDLDDALDWFKSFRTQKKK